jgi:putative ABC transport system permease protein
MSPASVRSAFGIAAMPTSVLIRTAAGTDLNRLAAHLQSQYVRNGLVVTDLAQAVRDQVASSRQFFQLMQGFLGLGLLVGISGLGVIMVRAVRERRRTIAMLRAMGFAARTVRRSFVAETVLIAAEGVVIGTGLGVLLTWLLYQNSPTFGDLNAAYPIAWRAIAVIVIVTLLASLLVTLAPARRAAHIKPAVALRIAD